MSPQWPVSSPTRDSALRSLSLACLAAGAFIGASCGDSGDDRDASMSDVGDAPSDFDVSGDPPDARQDAADDTDATEEAAPDAPVPGPPAITVVRPGDGEPAHQLFAVQVASSGGPIDSVTFEADGRQIGVDRFAPYSAVWWIEGVAEGSYEIAATAVGPGGSDTASVSVVVDHSPPQLVVVEPGTTTFGPIDGLLRAEVDVRDVSPIASVTFAIEGAELPVSVVRMAPWRADLDLAGLRVGSYTLVATATDAHGLTSSARAPFETCATGLLACLGNCLDPSFFDQASLHCGGCGNACQAGVQRCLGGECVCAAGMDACADGCRNTRTDANNCGRCANVCGEGATCAAGACVAGGPPEFVAVEPGTFVQGPSPSDAPFVEMEFNRPVTLTRPFAISRTEVTHAQWGAEFEFNPSEFWSCGPECPVESVTWWDALAYANALSERDGFAPCYRLEACNAADVGNGFECQRAVVTAATGDPYDCEGYRLPTEAEWEYAYRAGTTESTYNGAITSTACELNEHLTAIAWFSCNTDSPRPVATRAPNAFGLHDMAGNVFEWTADAWISEAEGHAVTDPSLDPASNPRLSEVTIRGGAWNERATRLRASSRLSQIPSERRYFTGFRLVRTLPEVP